jgi:hypothetical protein
MLQVVVEEQDAEAAALRDYLPVAFGTMHAHKELSLAAAAAAAAAVEALFAS